MDEPTVKTPTEISIPVVEIPVPVTVTEIVEVPVPVVIPVISEEQGEELTSWLHRVEQSVNALQELVQQKLAGLLEALQSQREINSSNQICLLRIESLLSSQNPQSQVPVQHPVEKEVVVIAPEEAEKQPKDAESADQKTRKKVRKV